MGVEFRLGEWLVQPQLNLLSSPDRQVSLQPKVMDVLVHLAAHSGEVRSKDSLIQAVWPSTFVTDDVLTHAVCELRKALEDDARSPRFIQTIPRRGYRLLVLPVFECTPPETVGDPPHPRDGESALMVQNRPILERRSDDLSRDLLRNMDRLEDELGTILDFIRAFTGALKTSLDAKEASARQNNIENASEGQARHNRAAAGRNSG